MSMAAAREETGRGSRVFAMSLGPAGQDVAARFHRERDRGRLRRMGVAVALGAVLMSGLLGVVGLRAQQVRLSYRLDALRTTRSETEELNRRMKVELATLLCERLPSAERVHELGMVAPGRDQVQLAREFVAGSGSVSRAVPPRTAAADRGSTGERTLRR